MLMDFNIIISIKKVNSVIIIIATTAIVMTIMIIAKDKLGDLITDKIKKILVKDNMVTIIIMVIKPMIIIIIRDITMGIIVLIMGLI